MDFDLAQIAARLWSRGKSYRGVGTSEVEAMTSPASDTVTLNTMVARLNIEHFLKRLSVEVDETKRQTLLNLISEETVKLSALEPITGA